MTKASSIGDKVAKRPKVKAAQRREQIIALQLAGMTQEKIADTLGVDRRTIVRDLSEMKPSTEHVTDVLQTLVTKIDQLHSIEDSAANYARLAKEAKNEAVRLATEDRIQDLRGVVTQKELVRTRRDEAAQPQAMFMLPPGTNVSVTVNASKPQPVVVEHNNAEVRNVTPTKEST